MPPIAFPIEIVHLEPLRSGHPLYSGQQTANMPPRDSSLYKITSKSRQRPKPQAKLTALDICCSDSLSTPLSCLFLPIQNVFD